MLAGGASIAAVGQAVSAVSTNTFPSLTFGKVVHLKKQTFLLGLFLCAHLASAASVKTMLAFADVHYDLLYSPTSTPERMCRGANDGPAQYYCDSSEWLVDSLFGMMSTTMATPDFIYYGGDTGPHNVNSSVIYQAQQRFLEQLRGRFPHTSTIMSLGNDDFPEDYEASCDPEWYQQLATLWTHHGILFDKSTFVKGGYYAVSPLPGMRALVLNTILYAAKNPLSLGTDPCGQFTWLRKELATAAAMNETVFVLAHAQPSHESIDSPRTGVPDRIWKPEYVERYLRIIRSLPPHAQLFGHMHEDSFRLMFASGEDSLRPKEATPCSVLIDLPPVTPKAGGNPTFRQYDIDFDDDTNAMHLRRYRQYNLDLAQEVPAWGIEYQSDVEYPALSDLGPARYRDLFLAVRDDEATRHKYIRHYPSSSPVASLLRLNLCAIQCLDDEAFEHCRGKSWRSSVVLYVSIGGGAVVAISFAGVATYFWWKRRRAAKLAEQERIAAGPEADTLLGKSLPGPSGERPSGEDTIQIPSRGPPLPPEVTV
ncbi:putative smpdl3a protein [Paratrimastix pyriformis]|uniref:Smpdl3a protein n=1 Tax=Paratrimastix pyriformis TaxID=342808 RepID=A0ABQ8U7H0_9EUKA|nr:putative smpdl3a protein [Paratrimastix pyriformis]